VRIADCGLRIADPDFFRSWRPALAGLTASIALSACGGSTSSTSPSTASTLTASLTDPAGDAVNLAVLRNGVSVLPIIRTPLPDLIAATVTVSGGTFTGTISFAPGTLSHNDTSACFMLDIDENSTTGTPSVGGDVRLGYDYSVCAVNPRNSTIGQVSRLGGGQAVGIGTVGVTFPSADQIRVVVPLAMLENDDGRMAFKVSVIQFVDDPVVFNSGTIDWMPDIGAPAGLVR
jgi:hypothetical protein